VDPNLPWIVVPALAAVAALYGSVGHGGASGYLAVLALAGLAPEGLRPAALTLNLVVSLVATFRFGAAGHLRVRLLLPFLAASVPAAFVGGSLPVDPEVYNLLLGAVLLLAGARLGWSGLKGEGDAPAGEVPGAGAGGSARRPGPALPVMFMTGLAIGLASGIIGVGGGIFLSPLLILMGWATARETAAIAAPFIFLNSAAGLAGQLLAGAVLPVGLPLWLGAVLAGGWIGATFGSRRARPETLRILLGLVLLIAAGKLLLS
jgi:uncharacterized protein